MRPTEVLWGSMDRSRTSATGDQLGWCPLVPQEIVTAIRSYRKDIKTLSEDAVLAYNAGHANSNDFVAVEVRGGQPRLLLDQGNGVSELWHDANVSDGQWHKITTVFRSDRLEISVDGNNKFSAPNKGTNKHIDLTDRLFIGGMELKKKTRAIRKAFKTNALSDAMNISNYCFLFPV